MHVNRYEIQSEYGPTLQACQVSRILRDSHAFILKHAFTHA